jgi:Phycobilisome degradation protein nblA
MNSEPIKLTPEQEFTLASFNLATKDLDRDSAIALLQSLYREAFIRDIQSRKVLGELILNRQWPQE